MKLLRDFIRLRAGDRPLRSARRNYTITVPQPLSKPAQATQFSMPCSMHWDSDPASGRPVAHWHEHVPPQSSGHPQRVSSY